MTCAIYLCIIIDLFYSICNIHLPNIYLTTCLSPPRSRGRVTSQNFISNDAEVLAVNCHEQASIRWIIAATAQVCSWYQPRVNYARSYKARKRLLRYIKKWIIYHLFCEEKKHTNTPIHKSKTQTQARELRTRQSSSVHMVGHGARSMTW